MRNGLTRLLGRLLMAVMIVSPVASQARQRGVWVEAYRSSPASYSFKPDETLPDSLRAMFAEKPAAVGTIRQLLAVSVGGRRLRVRFSNEEGRVPLRLDAASVAIAATGMTARPGTMRTLTFGGKAMVVIPPGAPMLSDPVDLPVAPLTELVVSAMLPDGLKPAVYGGAGLAHLPGDHTLDPKMDGAAIVGGRPVASGMLVETPTAPKLIVALGDSITDGNRSKPGELRGWPERLEQRLVAGGAASRLAVVNAGIGANRVLQPGAGSPALARFDRDVLALDHVSHVVLLEGINDIGMAGHTAFFGDWPALADADLIAGYRQIIARAHLNGVKVIMGTILPFKGAFYYNAAKERQRVAVNHWIRTSGEPDAVIDFAAHMADPADANRLRPAYDSGDHLHPNEVGYNAMGDFIDLSLFNR